MKKHKGNIVGDVGAVLFCILAMSIVFMACLNTIRIASFKEDVKIYARSYLLEMETVGYLTSSSATSFRQELTDIGATNIDFSSTTMSQVGYGQIIYLQVKCDIPAKALNTTAGDIVSFFFEDATYPVQINMKSTAKH